MGKINLFFCPFGGAKNQCLSTLFLFSFVIVYYKIHSLVKNDCILRCLIECSIWRYAQNKFLVFVLWKFIKNLLCLAFLISFYPSLSHPVLYFNFEIIYHLELFCLPSYSWLFWAVSHIQIEILISHSFWWMNIKKRKT